MVSTERLRGLVYQRSGIWGGLWTCVDLDPEWGKHVHVAVTLLRGPNAQAE